MSEQKRVLVVDDSKSARLVLRRMLENYDLHVDTVESANLALEFLAHNRPDAIFMDHMMPGMDGFQAVKAIKANPRTATIPVMMYTSKGGDLYIGQARALGAVGVLPKTVAPAELFESLRRIGVISDRRGEDRQPDDDRASQRAEDIEPRHAPPPLRSFSEPGMAPSGAEYAEQLDQHMRHLLEEQRVELRKDILLSMDTVARQTGARLHKDLEDRLAILETDNHANSRPTVLAFGVLAGVLAASLLGNLYLYQRGSNADNPPSMVADTALAGELEAERTALSGLASRHSRTLDRLQNSWATAAWAMNQNLHYEYDEIALDDTRVDTVEALLGRLADSGFSGKLVLETHAGQFCLTGDEDNGFQLPPPDLPLEQCSYIGNPVQAVDTPSAHQSLQFANFVSSTPLLSDGSISLEVTTLPRTTPLVAYPEQGPDSTALEWNRAAWANNRVSVSVVPEEQQAGNAREQ